MKKLLTIVFISAIFSCNSDKKDAPPSEGNYPAVENSNGNVPDTSNSINLNNKKVDSSAVKDSMSK